ncbi:hypothetical protein I553_8973 [Mycobacterium xenopi 4042]|uniref:Uncharacterized protein n=1 Tax=Mycobacterium xenopi 4042 TaxID=1299334 RepID=X8AP15_MYCXE|nr:hypothetical protein I553_8973 [Mycobacterium xenopi 4042]
MSMSSGPRSKTHRCLPKGSGEHSMRRPTTVAEVMVKTLQPIEVDCVLIDPHHLRDEL